MCIYIYILLYDIIHIHRHRHTHTHIYMYTYHISSGGAFLGDFPLPRVGPRRPERPAAAVAPPRVLPVLPSAEAASARPRAWSQCNMMVHHDNV